MLCTDSERRTGTIRSEVLVDVGEWRDLVDREDEDEAWSLRRESVRLLFPFSPQLASRSMFSASSIISDKVSELLDDIDSATDVVLFSSHKEDVRLAFPNDLRGTMSGVEARPGRDEFAALIQEQSGLCEVPVLSLATCVDFSSSNDLVRGPVSSPEAAGLANCGLQVTLLRLGAVLEPRALLSERMLDFLGMLPSGMLDPSISLDFEKQQQKTFKRKEMTFFMMKIKLPKRRV